MKAVAFRVEAAYPPGPRWRFAGAYTNVREALKLARNLGADGHLVKVWDVESPFTGQATVWAWNR